MTKESELRKNLIKTEEALEAKINEGSEASSILNDHREKALKVPKLDDQVAVEWQQPITQSSSSQAVTATQEIIVVESC